MVICVRYCTGKTILSIHHYLLHNNGEPLLIVAPPQKIKEGGWDRDIQTVANYYGIEISYDLLSYGKLFADWKKYKGWFVVFDECHYVKTSTSQRGKAAKNLVKASTYFLLLSATPSSNGWGDTINYFIMFNLAQSKTQFEREFGIFDTLYLGQRRVNRVVGWTRENVLKQMYQSFSVKLSKDDCLDLPPMVNEDVFFKRSTEYLKLKKDRILEVDGEKVVYDTYPKLAQGLRFYANQKNKLEYIEMLAESTNENIIIFYNFKAEKEALLLLMGKLKKKVFEVSGQRSELPARNTWPKLKDSVTLVQYQAGAAGIELQYANLVVFYTPTYSLQDYEQSLGRAYRNGQDKKVTVYHFITKDTIEELIYGALKTKKDFTDELFVKYMEGEK
ncbi:helicase-related protein [Lysinibacillus sphaericus]|uniref:helicase-related protein n=1 Tax=Lysinibacillus sphaericus TaxID=1421 RepID=UPI001F50F097|nr:DEAD/DEAH box helicase [Lysinibacillus sphaericus]